LSGGGEKGDGNEFSTLRDRNKLNTRKVEKKEKLSKSLGRKERRGGGKRYAPDLGFPAKKKGEKGEMEDPSPTDSRKRIKRESATLFSVVACEERGKNPVSK